MRRRGFLQLLAAACVVPATLLSLPKRPEVDWDIFRPSCPLTATELGIVQRIKERREIAMNDMVDRFDEVVWKGIPIKYNRKLG